MKKIKKYIYPFIFSIGFFVFIGISAAVINNFYGHREGYGGIGLALLLIILWILVAIPIFCLRYCKIILGEKLKFLFVLYNSLVIALSYTGPFFKPAVSGSDVDIIISIAAALFVWVAIWTFIPLLIQLNSTKEQANNNPNEIQE